MKSKKIVLPIPILFNLIPLKIPIESLLSNRNFQLMNYEK